LNQIITNTSKNFEEKFLFNQYSNRFLQKRILNKKIFIILMRDEFKFFNMNCDVVNFLTLTRASVRFVQQAISSLVDMSGYRFLINVISRFWSWCCVKCVLCRLCLLFFLPSLSSVSLTPTTPPGETTPPAAPNSCFTSGGVRTPEKC